MSQASIIVRDPIAASALSTPVAVTTWPRAAAYAIFAVLAAVILLTFGDYGISWDEWLQNTYGLKLLDYYTSGLEDEAAFEFVNLFLYGGFFDMLAAILNLVSPFGEYATRHLLGGMIFLSGLVGGWKLARLLAGERAGLIALICLATTPLLYGHGFINPKDSPLAWFAIWTIYFACRLMEPGRPTWKTVVGFGVSLGLTVGTRVIGVVYIDYFVAVLAITAGSRMIMGEPWQAQAARMKASALAVGVIVLIAFVVMAFFWPWSVQEPLNLVAALRSFAHFAFYPLVLWNGELIRADHMPHSYLPGLIVLQLPEYILLGLAAASISAVIVWRRRILTLFAEPRAQQYLFVVAAGTAPIVGYVLFDPTIYNGLRHFLFVVPPLVILGAIGLDRLLSVVEGKHRTAGLILAGVLALAALRQTVLMARLHPYEYVSYNSFVGGVAGATNRFELDYWGTSLAESARALGAVITKDPSLGLTTGVPAKVFACGDRTSAENFLPHGAVWTGVLAEADFYMGMTGVPCEGYEKPGKIVVEIKRLGVVIGYVRDLRHPWGRRP